VRFEPGVNEDLAATAVWGTQQANLHPGAKYDGVFGIWYGKGPGVDRSCDALKHANYAGTAAQGGVLALCGDDPGAKSSSIAHQSEHALIHCGIPILNPSSVQEYLDLGLAGFALSRFSGCWVGMKCLTDTVDSAASVEVGPDRARFVEPEFERGAGFHIGWVNMPAEVEKRLYQQRLPAAQAFVRANQLDRVVLGAPRCRIGIVTTGKAYLDVREALVELGIDDALAAELGLSIYKVAMSWPLEPEGALEFCRGLDDVLVVEEKRVVIEDQLARLLVNQAERPRLAGKRDASGVPLVPAEGELAPGLVAALLRHWLESAAPGSGARLRPAAAAAAASPPGQLTRLPAFCSGCPHNTSTVVPDGSVALGGIGCHGMAAWMPERRTLAVTQMGGEGANWIGQAPFTSVPHIFQNMGDGTYFHSGLVAIRAAVAANVNVTYKLLVNGAVAMTGGQPIEGEPMAGEITCPEIARQLSAEGVKRIAVVSDDPERFPGGSLPAGVTVHHRDSLDAVQKELREVPGVSAIVYDQTCAAEARRLRKRGEFPDPDRRVVINEQLCEGCGDCSVQSNCISIEPVETELGRKRRINQSSCNKDYSCVKGHCPSFVSVIGGQVRKAKGEGVGATDALFANLPDPVAADCTQPWNLLITGIGGTGVVTVGAIVAMAAHLEGKGCSELDVTGLAQKNGPVSSHVRVAHDAAAIFASRIGVGAADLVIGCDLVVATNPENLPRARPGRTAAVMNQDVAPTADFARNSDLDLSSERMEAAVREACGDDAAHFVNASQLATVLLGDAIGANLLLVGYAAQLGKLPVSLAALERAIELNGRQVEMNRRAVAWGRLLAHDPAAVERVARPLLRGAAGDRFATTLDEIVADRSDRLTAYQDAKYAERYRSLVTRVAERERGVAPNSDALARAVARGYAKLLAYKDEYEVARLYSDGAFAQQVEREFEGDYRLRLHLDSNHVIPFGLAPKNPDTGRTKKFALPAGLMLPVFRLMARGKRLRGTPLDLFGLRAHRRFERRSIAEYEATIGELLEGIGAENLPTAVEIASLPEHVRGFDDVKERQHAEMLEKQKELLGAFRLQAS
jgi:indolepyruvate ferredoxin oxidoreductase